MSWDIRQLLTPTAPPPVNARSAKVEIGALLDTWNGIGDGPFSRDNGRAFFRKLVGGPQHSAAAPAPSGGALPVAAGGIMGGAAAADAASLVADPGVAPYTNEVYGGLMTQSYMRDGFVPPTGAAGGTVDLAARLAGSAPVAAVNEQAAAAAAGVSGAAGAAPTVDDAAIRSAQTLQDGVVNDLARLGAVDPPTQIATIARAIDDRAAAGGGASAYETLVAALADGGPLEQVAPLLSKHVDGALATATEHAAAAGVAALGHDPKALYTLEDAMKVLLKLR